METRLTFIVVEIAIILVIQAALVFGVWRAVRKSRERMTALTEDLHQRAVPLLDAANAMMQTTRPQLESVVSNLAYTAEVLRKQADKVDSTVTDIIDRTRLQVVRADELVSRTMDRVENTSDMVHHTVISPVRQITGVLQGLSTGFNVLFGNRKRRRDGNGVGVPRDEMFI
jgi:hypothetical protein